MTSPIVQPIGPGAGTDWLTGFTPFGAFCRVVCHDWSVNLTVILCPKRQSFCAGSRQIARRCCGAPRDRFTSLDRSMGPDFEPEQALQAACRDPRQPSRARCQNITFACFLTISADGDALRCAGTPRVLVQASRTPETHDHSCDACWVRCLLTLDGCRQLRTGPLTDPYAGERDGVVSTPFTTVKVPLLET